MNEGEIFMIEDTITFFYGISYSTPWSRISEKAKNFFWFISFTKRDMNECQERKMSTHTEKLFCHTIDYYRHFWSVWKSMNHKKSERKIFTFARLVCDKIFTLFVPISMERKFVFLFWQFPTIFSLIWLIRIPLNRSFPFRTFLFT
jgi:hypothetical protein